MNDDLISASYTSNLCREVYDYSNIWDEKMLQVRNSIAQKNSDSYTLSEIRKIIEEPLEKTEEDRVIDIVNGDFEKYFNMSIAEFQGIYEKILKENPEKLI